MEKALPRSRWARWIPFILVTLLGMAVRLPQLEARPMHTDEAVNAYIVGQLLAGDAFTYDSKDRHGPALAALALPLARMQGARSFSDLTESELRLTSVVAGTITILLFGAAVDMFGYLPSLLAAMLFAFGPLPVYYDRYFIHESLFCAATFGLILSGWRAFETRSVGYAALAGACAALMCASKETAILHLFALVFAAVVFRIWNLRGERPAESSRPWPFLAAAGTFLALLVILFTWFGRAWNVLPALLHAAPDFLARAAGQGHQKPLWYYAPASHRRVVGWTAGRPRVPRVPHQHQKAQRFTLCSIGVLHVPNRRTLQSHSIQDTMAGAEHLASACIICRKCGRIRVELGRKEGELPHSNPSGLRCRSARRSADCL